VVRMSSVALELPARRILEEKVDKQGNITSPLAISPKIAYGVCMITHAGDPRAAQFCAAQILVNLLVSEKVATQQYAETLDARILPQAYTPIIEEIRNDEVDHSAKIQGILQTETSHMPRKEVSSKTASFFH